MKPTKVTAALVRSMPLPDLDDCADKEARGRVLVVAGSSEVPGAAVLSGEAALRAGAGKLQMAAAAPWAMPMAFAVPEARVVEVSASRGGEIAAGAATALLELARRADAVVIGPGMLEPHSASRLALDLLAGCPDARFLVDAAALTGLSKDAARVKDCGGLPVLTPHAGEMASLLGVARAEVEADPTAAARTAAARLGAVVVMKGQTTEIVTPEGEAWRHEGGVVGLGTGGSGDVLAGLIGGLLARGAAPAQAAIWGVHVHGAAGEALTRRWGAVGFLARELLAEIPPILEQLRTGSPAAAAPATSGAVAR